MRNGGGGGRGGRDEKVLRSVRLFSLTTVEQNGLKLWGSGAFFLPPQGMYYPVSVDRYSLFSPASAHKYIFIRLVFSRLFIIFSFHLWKIHFLIVTTSRSELLLCIVTSFSLMHCAFDKLNLKCEMPAFKNGHCPSVFMDSIVSLWFWKGFPVVDCIKRERLLIWGYVC